MGLEAVEWTDGELNLNLIRRAAGPVYIPKPREIQGFEPQKQNTLESLDMWVKQRAQLWAEATSNEFCAT